MENKRWYDQDPLLQEALELLSLTTDDKKNQAADFILQLQDQVAAEVIERVYESVAKYSDKGSRWYDKDPVIIKAIELLRVSPPHIQRVAAKKLLTSLYSGNMDKLNFSEESIETE